ncbi:Glyceraldehyde-3-phosphate dehydrogenase, testis-specific like [Melia azedarach]|uniref:Glyceraldehyde-3-phosphate dehydrogenase, testis-specific like n=1 Tax=Melia azedarach TaxID=155640 RepID=A0ACC1Y6V7_MELAZ|nr:Glyceraldehyde-3-phosphate dehydrogenase, testis-specific like [Melia azedarach]
MSDAGESQHSPADSGAVTPGNVAVFADFFELNQALQDDEGTSVTMEMLAQLRKAYDIPSFVELSLPRLGFRPSQLGSSEVVIHRQSFEYGLRLPIQPFFGQILSGLGVAPAQLSSMAWRNLAGLYILWKEVLGVEPTIEDVHATFTLTTAPKKPGALLLEDVYWPISSRAPGALGDEVLTPSSATRRMAKGSKTNLAFLQLVRDRMAKAVGASSQRAATGSEGGSFLMSQFGDKLKEGSTSAGRVAKLEAQLSRLTQKVKDKDDQISKLEDQLGEVRDVAGSVKTQLRAQVERANELQASVDKLETEAGSNLLHGYHYAQYQVTREFPDLDLHYMDFGFDREALVAKFGKEQDPTDVAGSSRQLTSGHPLNLEVSPPHSDHEEDDSDDEGSQLGNGEDT